MISMNSIRILGRIRTLFKSSSICKLTDNFIITSSFRLKYTQHTGVKGLKNRKPQNFTNQENDTMTEIDHGNETEKFNLSDEEYDILASSTMNVARDVTLTEQRVFVIQPYIKWGPKKQSTKPDLQLQEAEALIRSLPRWSVELSMKVALDSLERKALFGSGKLKEIKETLKKCSTQKKAITCIFISKATLSFLQKNFLQNEFGVPVMDRYSIVIQILRLHATSIEAKLQVAMAEIPYIWNQIKDLNPSSSKKKGYSLNDTKKELLNKREKKLKEELKNVRNRRKLLRSKRKKENYPIVAVVGYTNVGKTSLIKALTNDQTIQPKDRFFATLDVTAHRGILPCKLEIIYMDTVGFMSDLPTGLIECFISTLEDAMLSDIIIHVQDLSHENYEEQKHHVENTLKSLLCFTENSKNDENTKNKIPPIINVGNKIDLIKNTQEISKKYSELKLISSKVLTGIYELMLEIESKILEKTNHIKLTIRVSNGGQEMEWLYKNATITNSKADPNDYQSILLDVIIHNSKLQIFKHHFVTDRNN